MAHALFVVFVCCVVRETMAVPLLRRDDPVASLEEREVTIEAETSKVLSSRMEMLMEAYGGLATFDGVGEALYQRNMDESVDKILSKADAWAQTGENATHEGHAMGIYGEIRPAGVLRVLRTISTQPGDVFVDLGSGAGKLPIIASQIFGMVSTGIELVPKRHANGCNALQKLSELAHTRSKAGESDHVPVGSVQLLQGSFFDFDFSNADVVFMDSLVWSEKMMSRLGEMCEGMKPGSKVVNSAGGLDLPAQGFVKDIVISAPVTWGKKDHEAEYQVYKKVTESDLTALKGKNNALELAQVNGAVCVY